MTLTRYFSNVENAASGRPLAGASVRVTRAGTLSSLYADKSGTVRSNPVVTDEDGNYDFYVEAGEYTLEFGFGGQPIRTITDVPIGMGGGGGTGLTDGDKGDIIVSGGGTQLSLDQPRLKAILQAMGGTMLAAGAGIALAYDQPTDVLTISATGGGGAFDAEAARDAIAAALVAGSGVTIAHDDAANTITITGTGGGAADAPEPIGLFTAASSKTITGNVVQTSGYSTHGLGGARYIFDATINAAYVAARPRYAFLSSNGRGFRLKEFTLEPEMFGAVGNGTTDDQPAFDALNAAFARTADNLGAAGLRLRPVTYLGGGQKQNSNGLYQEGVNIIEVKGLTYFEYHVAGTELRFKPNLKFGSFNPSTGQPTTGVNTIPSQRADIGIGLYVQDVSVVRGYGNLYSDGQIHTATLGGEWGDVGRQCIHDAFAFVNCQDVEVESITAYRFGRDGGYIANYGLTAASTPRPHVLKRFVTRQCARNGISIIGGNKVTIEDSDLEGGLAYNNALAGSWGSSPRSGLDIEPEGSIARNTAIRRTVMRCALPTAGTASVADSGDSAGTLYEDCVFKGTFWTRKPGTKTVRCVFEDRLVLLGGNINPDDDTALEDYRIVDGGQPGDGSPILNAEGAGGRIVLRDGVVDIGRRVANFRGADIQGTLDLLIRHNIDNTPDGTTLAFFENSRFDRIRIRDLMDPAKLPPTGYQFFARQDAASAAKGNTADIFQTSGKLGWHTTTPLASGGRGGRLYSGVLSFAGVNNPSIGATFFNVPIVGADPTDDPTVTFSEFMPAGVTVSAIPIASGAQVTIRDNAGAGLTIPACIVRVDLRKRTP